MPKLSFRYPFFAVSPLKKLQKVAEVGKAAFFTVGHIPFRYKTFGNEIGIHSRLGRREDILLGVVSDHKTFFRVETQLFTYLEVIFRVRLTVARVFVGRNKVEIFGI